MIAGCEQGVSARLRPLETVAAVSAAAVGSAPAAECEVACVESGAELRAPRAARRRAGRCVGRGACDRGRVRRSLRDCARRFGRMREQQAAAHGGRPRSGQSAHQARAGHVRIDQAVDPAAVDRWRVVVASFEAAPPSRPGKPDWGHAEALTMLGEAYLQRAIRWRRVTRSNARWCWRRTIGRRSSSCRLPRPGRVELD